MPSRIVDYRYGVHHNLKCRHCNELLELQKSRILLARLCNGSRKYYCIPCATKLGIIVRKNNA